MQACVAQIKQGLVDRFGHAGIGEQADIPGSADHVVGRKRQAADQRERRAGGVQRGDDLFNLLSQAGRGGHGQRLAPVQGDVEGSTACKHPRTPATVTHLSRERGKGFVYSSRTGSHHWCSSHIAGCSPGARRSLRRPRPLPPVALPDRSGGADHPRGFAHRPKAALARERHHLHEHEFRRLHAFHRSACGFDAGRFKGMQVRDQRYPVVDSSDRRGETISWGC